MARERLQVVHRLESRFRGALLVSRPRVSPASSSEDGVWGAEREMEQEHCLLHLSLLSPRVCPPARDCSVRVPPKRW